MNSPLVSIIVITYNSSTTIEQTLESIKSQTYKRIELIVSDDCSKDSTVDVVKDWLNKNKQCFERTEIVTVEKNTGTCGNLNRGVKASHGEWLKPIAGDDYFEPIAIETYLSFVIANNSDFCYARMNYIGDEEFVKDTISFYEGCCEPIMRTGLKNQQKKIREMLFIPGPGIFLSRKLYDQIGGYNERYMFADEWPQFYSIIKGGVPIRIIEDKLVNYRVSVGSLCHQKENDGLSISPLVFYSTRLFYDEVIFWDELKTGLLLTALDHKIDYYITSVILKYTKKSYQYKIARLLKFTSPLVYVRFIKSRVWNKTNK